MKTVTLILLTLSLLLITMSAEYGIKFALYIGVFGVLVSFLVAIDILIIQPKQKSKNSF
jgi:preprotein translocase subunit SecF